MGSRSKQSLSSSLPTFFLLNQEAIMVKFLRNKLVSPLVLAVLVQYACANRLTNQDAAFLDSFEDSIVGSAEILDTRAVASASKAKKSKDGDCNNSFMGGGAFFSIRCSNTGQDICQQMNEFYAEFTELRNSYEKLAEYVRTIDSKPPMPGAPGNPGPRGERGQEGKTGGPGNPGTSGSAGIPGKIGLNGQPGESGQPGPSGAPGFGGTAGPPGFPGEKGSDGSRGEIGDKGCQGDRGIDGQNGMKGSRGAVGEAGVNGVDGVNGVKGVD